jgi:NADH dehydrogenase [ubiquinone] 1 alpha subcomplex assembly factor 1
MKHFVMVILVAAITMGCVNRSTEHTVTTKTGHQPTGPLVIYDFTAQNKDHGWSVEDDDVMGGRSQGAFALSEDGHGVFSGRVSLENNGGFSSVQHFLEPRSIAGYRTAHLRLKGDGKRYQFIVEAEPEARHYYMREFQTGTDWETITLPLPELVPMRRGDRLDRPNFPAQTLTQVRFLIANGVAESFRLEIDRIWLE